MGILFCSCPFLHRTAGDTERRYHLRYYKTCPCVHETDSKGHCVKNGPHCAFAHGEHDLRPAVYDDREMQNPELAEKIALGETPASMAASQLEKDKIINEDPRWNGKFVAQYDNCSFHQYKTSIEKIRTRLKVYKLLESSSGSCTGKCVTSICRY